MKGRETMNQTPKAILFCDCGHMFPVYHLAISAIMCPCCGDRIDVGEQHDCDDCMDAYHDSLVRL